MSENLENSVIVSKIPQTKDYNEQASELVKDSQTRNDSLWYSYTLSISSVQKMLSQVL